MLKLLQIMFEKGLVRRDESNRPHVFRAAVAENQVKRRLVNDLLELTKVEAGKVVVHPIEFEAAELFGTLRGMQVRTSSRELGRLTTAAVVQSIFLVILADAVFAILFLELDI